MLSHSQPVTKMNALVQFELSTNKRVVFSPFPVLAVGAIQRQVRGEERETYQHWIDRVSLGLGWCAWIPAQLSRLERQSNKLKVVSLSLTVGTLFLNQVLVQTYLLPIILLVRNWHVRSKGHYHAPDMTRRSDLRRKSKTAVVRTVTKHRDSVGNEAAGLVQRGTHW